MVQLSVIVARHLLDRLNDYKGVTNINHTIWYKLIHLMYKY